MTLILSFCRELLKGGILPAFRGRNGVFSPTKKEPSFETTAHHYFIGKEILGILFLPPKKYNQCDCRNNATDDLRNRNIHV